MNIKNDSSWSEIDSTTKGPFRYMDTWNTWIQKRYKRSGQQQASAYPIPAMPRLQPRVGSGVFPVMAVNVAVLNNVYTPVTCGDSTQVILNSKIEILSHFKTDSKHVAAPAAIASPRLHEEPAFSRIHPISFGYKNMAKKTSRLQ